MTVNSKCDTRKKHLYRVSRRSRRKNLVVGSLNKSKSHPCLKCGLPYWQIVRDDLVGECDQRLVSRSET